MQYRWYDFEEDESSDAIPDKYVLSIVNEDAEEVAVIVHRTVGGRYPLDGALASWKRENAQRIVDALNASEVPS